MSPEGRRYKNPRSVSSTQTLKPRPFLAFDVGLNRLWKSPLVVILSPPRRARIPPDSKQRLREILRAEAALRMTVFRLFPQAMKPQPTKLSMRRLVDTGRSFRRGTLVLPYPGHNISHSASISSGFSRPPREACYFCRSSRNRQSACADRGEMSGDRTPLRVAMCAP